MNQDNNLTFKIKIITIIGTTEMLGTTIIIETTTAIIIVEITTTTIIIEIQDATTMTKILVQHSAADTIEHNIVGPVVLIIILPKIVTSKNKDTWIMQPLQT